MSAKDLPRWFFLSFETEVKEVRPAKTTPYETLRVLNTSGEYTDAYFLAIVYPSTDPKELEGLISDRKNGDRPVRIFFHVSQKALIVEIVRKLFGAQLKRLPKSKVPNIAEMEKDWRQKIASTSLPKLVDGQITNLTLYTISDTFESAPPSIETDQTGDPPILTTPPYTGQKTMPEPVIPLSENAKKDEIITDKDPKVARIRFLQVAERMAKFVREIDSDGTVRIATQTAGPWVGQLPDEPVVNLDEALLSLYTDIRLAKGTEIAQSRVRIVCPFSLSNLHVIRQWHVRGIGIHVNPSMNETILKWMVIETFASRELLLGYPLETIELPMLGEDGVTKYDKASSGFHTKDMLAVSYFINLFDNMYNTGHSLPERGAQLLALQLKNYLDETFDKWDNKVALVPGPKPVLMYDQQDVSIEVAWADDRKVFRLEITANKRADAFVISHHLDSLRQNAKYNLGDTVDVTIVEE